MKLQKVISVEPFYAASGPIGSPSLTLHWRLKLACQHSVVRSSLGRHSPPDKAKCRKGCGGDAT